MEVHKKRLLQKVEMAASTFELDPAEMRLMLLCVAAADGRGLGSLPSSSVHSAIPEITNDEALDLICLKLKKLGIAECAVSGKFLVYHLFPNSQKE